MTTDTLPAVRERLAELREQFADAARGTNYDERMGAMEDNFMTLLALAEAAADSLLWLDITTAEKRAGVVAGVVLQNAQEKGLEACDKMRAVLAELAGDEGEVTP